MVAHDRPISRAWMSACEALAKRHGKPLPVGTLSLGDTESGWFTELNNRDDENELLPPFQIGVQWNGFPAGAIGPFDGVIAAGELANEDSFIKWLEEIE